MSAFRGVADDAGWGWRKAAFDPNRRARLWRGHQEWEGRARRRRASHACWATANPLKTKRSTNVRQKRSTVGLGKELKEAREQQAATSEVLEAINRSGFDLDGILRTVVSTAARLCNTGPAGIFLLEGDIYKFRAGQHLSDAYREHEKRSRIRAGLGTLVGRVALEKGVVCIVDALNDIEYEDKEAAAANNLRSMLGVPLLRDGKPVGVFALARTRVEPFSESQIRLVSTFANQAVIAIENAAVQRDAGGSGASDKRLLLSRHSRC